MLHDFQELFKLLLKFNFDDLIIYKLYILKSYFLLVIIWTSFIN